MKTRYAILLSTIMAAAFVACGGSQQATNDNREKVYVETSGAITIADAAVVNVSGTGAVVGAVGPFTLTYSATTGKFSGNLFLAPDTYSLTINVYRADGTTLIGSATTTGVVVNGTSVKTVSLNVASIGEPLPAVGFVITGFSGAGYVDVGANANFSVTAVSADAHALTYAWTRSGTGCTGTFGTPAAATTTFSAASAQVCTVTVTVTDTVNTNLKATRQQVIGVGVDLQISGTVIPSPTITSVTFFGNGGYSLNAAATAATQVAEPTCTLTRTGTATASQTCPGVYKILSGPPLDPLAPTLTLSTPQFDVLVVYDLGGIYDASKPPTVGLTADCPNSTTDGVSQYSFDNVPANPINGSGPGVCGTTAGSCTGSSPLWWYEPIAFVAPATTDICTVTITVKNQGAVDSFPAKIFLTQ